MEKGERDSEGRILELQKGKTVQGHIGGRRWFFPYSSRSLQPGEEEREATLDVFLLFTIKGL